MNELLSFCLSFLIKNRKYCCQAHQLQFFINDSQIYLSKTLYIGFDELKVYYYIVLLDKTNKTWIQKKPLKHQWRKSLFALAVVCLLLNPSFFPPLATACIITPFSSTFGIKGRNQPFGILQWESLVFCGEIKGPICGGGDEGLTGGGQQDGGHPLRDWGINHWHMEPANEMIWRNQSI